MDKETYEDDFEGLEKFIPDLIPEGAMPLTAVMVLEYVRSDGESDYVYATFGEMKMAQAIGLTDIGKWMMFSDIEEDE